MGYGRSPIRGGAWILTYFVTELELSPGSPASRPERPSTSRGEGADPPSASRNWHCAYETAGSSARTI
jgi:hypothetical protein